MPTILLINGPNINLLGTREPHLYGSTTLDTVVSTVTAQAKNLNATIQHFQSNHEGAIIDRLHAARGNVDAIIVNPGGLTHTSVPLRDALLGIEIPFIEVHVTNIHSREPWREKSFLSDKATGVICGLGVYGYEAAVEFCVRMVREKERRQGQAKL